MRVARGSWGVLTFAQHLGTNSCSTSRQRPPENPPRMSAWVAAAVAAAAAAAAAAARGGGAGWDPKRRSCLRAVR
jgi:hypothetical protein